MHKRKKATIQKAMRGGNGNWSALVRIDGTKTDVLVRYGETEPTIGKRLTIEGSGRDWVEV